MNCIWTDWNDSDSLSKDAAWRAALSLQWWFSLIFFLIVKECCFFIIWLLAWSRQKNLETFTAERPTKRKLWYTVTQLKYYTCMTYCICIFTTTNITVWICIVLFLLSHYICSFAACVVLVASIWSSWGTVILSVIPAHSGCTTSIPYFDRAWPGTTPSTLSLPRSLSLALWSQPPQDPISITLG